MQTIFPVELELMNGVLMNAAYFVVAKEKLMVACKIIINKSRGE